MTEPQESALQEAGRTPGDTRVERHDVTFQLRVRTVNGEEPTEDGPLYKLLAVADEDLFSRLPVEVAGWRYRDNYEIDCDRLELCETEFGYDDALPEGVTLYDISVSATREIPLRRVDANEDYPLSVEQLLKDVPPLLLDIYAKHGVVLELHKVRYYKQFTHSEQGAYVQG